MARTAACAGCGKPIVLGGGSLPAGQATCRECRRAQRPECCRIWIRNCTQCRSLFVARNPRHTSCGPACSRKRANRSDDYHRWKRGKRRTVTKDSDITPQQEAAMRKRARKCPLCSVFMTSKPRQPNTKHLDHIVPVNIGGTHTHGNVRIICRTCNLARPKDGSDYFGPITLWATATDVSLTIKPRPQPQQAKPPRQPKARVALMLCACGGEIYNRGHGSVRCHECAMKLGREAAALRATGMQWQAIADALEYGNVGGIYTLASKYGCDEALKDAM